MEDPFLWVRKIPDRNDIFSMIYASNRNEPFLLQMIKVENSDFSDKKLHYSVFSTILHFSQRFVPTYSPYSRNLIILVFDGKKTRAFTRDSSSHTYVNYYFPSLANVVQLFPKNQMFVFPDTPGAYTKEEVEKFTKSHYPFYEKYKFDRYDLTEATAKCANSEIWAPEFVEQGHDIGLRYTDSKTFTIKPGKAQCLYGNFVLDSKQDYMATIEYVDTSDFDLYNQNLKKSNKKYENPFSITTERPDERNAQLIKLECKSLRKLCQIQAISVLPPIQRRHIMTPMKIESIFTTNSSLSLEKEIIINDEEIELFTITVHNKNKFKVKVSSDNDQIKNLLSTSDSYTTDEVTHNTVTIYPYYDLFKFIRDEENISIFKMNAKVKVEVEPIETVSDEEEIIENNLFLRLPSNGGGKTKQEVTEFNKEEEELDKGHGGLILSISIGLTTVLSLAIIIYSVIMHIIYKKKDQQKEQLEEQLLSDIGVQEPIPYRPSDNKPTVNDKEEEKEEEEELLENEEPPKEEKVDKEVNESDSNSDSSQEPNAKLLLDSSDLKSYSYSIKDNNNKPNDMLLNAQNLPPQTNQEQKASVFGDSFDSKSYSYSNNNKPNDMFVNAPPILPPPLNQEPKPSAFGASFDSNNNKQNDMFVNAPPILPPPLNQEPKPSAFGASFDSNNNKPNDMFVNPPSIAPQTNQEPKPSVFGESYDSRSYSYTDQRKSNDERSESSDSDSGDKSYSTTNSVSYTSIF